MRDATHRGRERGISPNEIARIRAVYDQRERIVPRTNKVDIGNRGNWHLLHEHRGRLGHILREGLGRVLADCRVLDVGCGYGSLLAWFHEQGVPAQNLFGVDLLPNRIAAARSAYPHFTFAEGNAERFDLPDHSFDLVPVFTVFSSILDRAMAENVARDISRILAPGGAVVWYDMRYPNPWNPSLKAMTRQRIRHLFPGFSLELESISLIPQLARRLGPLTDRAYPALAAIPSLRSHLLGLLRPLRSADRDGRSAGRCPPQ
jgi:SAM-dependent methyltransferase